MHYNIVAFVEFHNEIRLMCYLSYSLFGNCTLDRLFHWPGIADATDTYRLVYSSRSIPVLSSLLLLFFFLSLFAVFANFSTPFIIIIISSSLGCILSRFDNHHE